MENPSSNLDSVLSLSCQCELRLTSKTVTIKMYKNILNAFSFTVGFVSDSNTTGGVGSLVAFRGLISKSIVNWAQLGTEEMLMPPAPNSMKWHFPAAGEKNTGYVKQAALMTN